VTRKLHDRPFPMAALFEISDRVMEDTERATGGANKLARLIQVHPSAMTRARGPQGGMLTVHQADEWAVRLGYHPWEIWGDQWFDPDSYEEGIAG
jgi:hypothetical protein